MSHEITKKELTEILLINKRMDHLSKDLEKVIDTTKSNYKGKENEDPVIETAGPTPEELEDFVLKNFDYLGELEYFIDTHKDYLETLYKSDFRELVKYSDQNMGYLDILYHKDNFDQMNEDQ